VVNFGRSRFAAQEVPPDKALRQLEHRLIIGRRDVELVLQFLVEVINVGAGVGIGSDRDHQTLVVGQDGEGHSHVSRSHTQREDVGNRAAEKSERCRRSLDVADERVDPPLVVDEALIEPEPGQQAKDGPQHGRRRSPLMALGRPGDRGDGC
jgi:hypothetical protein